jgi:hypothetical protein
MPHRIPRRRSQTRWSCTVELCLTITKYELGVTRGVTPYLCSDDRDNPRNVSILRCIHRYTWWVTRGPVHATRSTAIRTLHHNFTGRDRKQSAATAAHDTPNICCNRHVRLLSTQTAGRPPACRPLQVIATSLSRIPFISYTTLRHVMNRSRRFETTYCLHLHGSIIL